MRWDRYQGIRWLCVCLQVFSTGCGTKQGDRPGLSLTPLAHILDKILICCCTIGVSITCNSDLRSILDWWVWCQPSNNVWNSALTYCLAATCGTRGLIPIDQLLGLQNVRVQLVLASGWKFRSVALWEFNLEQLVHLNTNLVLCQNRGSSNGSGQ